MSFIDLSYFSLTFQLSFSKQFVFHYSATILATLHTSNMCKLSLSVLPPFCLKCYLLVELIKVKVILRLTVGQSVRLGVEPALGLVARLFFFFFFKFAVLSPWDALSDERSGIELVGTSHKAVSLRVPIFKRPAV
jgi:hypothetical protein